MFNSEAYLRTTYVVSILYHFWNQFFDFGWQNNVTTFLIIQLDQLSIFVSMNTAREKPI